MGTYVDPKGIAGSNSSPNNLPNEALTATVNRKGQVLVEYIDEDCTGRAPTDEEVKAANGQWLTDVPLHSIVEKAVPRPVIEPF